MSNDTQLKQAVLDELQWEPSVNAAHIGVTAHAGVVTLMGHVETYSEKYAAEKAARRVKDTHAITEQIEVRLPLHIKRTDEDIAAAAIDRLAWDAAIPKDAVQVKVESGWVTLMGDVDWHYQQDAAAADVRGLWGVVGVSNIIKIKPRADATNIKEHIMTALHRSWFNPKSIEVTAHDGRVTLSGNVRYWSERDDAFNTAWASPGVTSVVNDIRVN
jgi:osmotically-inducible protein OsmY